MPQKVTERINFGKIKEVISPPNLIEIQLDSYKEFLQADVAQSKRKNTGLQAVFTEVFPIESYDGKTVLDFHSYEIQEPKVDWLECLREGLTEMECGPTSYDFKRRLGCELVPTFVYYRHDNPALHWLLGHARSWLEPSEEELK